MGISIWQLLIVLVIVLLLFGTKKLKQMGPDLGSAIRGFRTSMKDGSTEDKDPDPADIENEESTAATSESDSAGEKRDSA